MSRRVRQGVRVLHLVAAGVLGTYVYSPWSADPTFAALVRWVGFPLLAASGIFLWRGHLLVRALRKPA